MLAQAIVDSGTSLVALPKEMLSQIEGHIGHINNDCSNVDELPTVRFHAGEHIFELPPQVELHHISTPLAISNGSSLGLARSPATLLEDMAVVRPTVLVAVPQVRPLYPPPPHHIRI